MMMMMFGLGIQLTWKKNIVPTVCCKIPCVHIHIQTMFSGLTESTVLPFSQYRTFVIFYAVQFEFYRILVLHHL